MLDNEPTEIGENGELWVGTELPFEPRHVIAVDHANETSLEMITRPAAIPWAGD